MKLSLTDSRNISQTSRKGVSNEHEFPAKPARG
jgi:hypothetical protein